MNASTGRGARRGQDVTTREIEDLCVDFRRGGMSYRQMAKAVTSTMRARFLDAHMQDRQRAIDEAREPIPAKQDWSVTHEACRLAVKRAMKKTEARRDESGQELRDLELSRLDMLQMALWPKAVGDPAKQKGPDTQAVLAILKIMERRESLTGIDASTLGQLGEEGAEVRFGVWTPDEIAKRKKELQATLVDAAGAAVEAPAPPPASVPVTLADAAAALANGHGGDA